MPAAAGDAVRTARKVAATARAVAGAVATAGAAVGGAVSRTMAPPTGAWVDELEAKLPGEPIRTTLAGWAAAGLSPSALQATFAAAASPQALLGQLREAGKQKGLYQLRVLLEDYVGLPGVSATPYVPNGLPLEKIPASRFGVNDAALDLEGRQAATFRGKAELVALKPGEKLYRVTSDPIDDPLGHAGGYWTRTPPASLAEVIGGTAVMPEWNNFQRVYQFTVPDPAKDLTAAVYHAWEGPAVAQPVSGFYPEKADNGRCLPGGDNQLFIPAKLAYDPRFGNHFEDVTSKQKVW